MVVQARLKNAPSYSVASLMHVGPYRPDMLRAEFSRLMSWAKKRKLRTGKWFAYFHDEPGGRRPASKFRSEACLEIRGRAKPEGKIRIKKLPKQRVASVVFNPNQISPDLIYGGLYGWVQYSGLRNAGPPREIYTSDPWKNARAWANVEVQMPVKRK